MTETESRERFEKFIEGDPFYLRTHLRTDLIGVYRSGETQRAWIVWQEAERRLILEQARLEHRKPATS